MYITLSECKLSKCANENWDKILAQILDPLQQFFNNFCTYFSNTILLQVKYSDLFSATQVPPTIVSTGIPQGPLPVTINQVSLPVQNQLLPGGAVVVPALPSSSTGGQLGGNIYALPGVVPQLPGGSAITGLPLGSAIPIQGSSSSAAQPGALTQNLGVIPINPHQGSNSSGVQVIRLLPGGPIQNIVGVPSNILQGGSVTSGGPTASVGNALLGPLSSVLQNSEGVGSIRSSPNLDPSATTAPVGIPAGQPGIVNLNLALLSNGGTGSSGSAAGGGVSKNSPPLLSAVPLVG